MINWVALYSILFSVITFNSAVKADDGDTLLNTELEFVSELLAMGRPTLAQQHLNIIRTEFPGQKNDILYYQGAISFRLADYKYAILCLEKLMKLNPRQAREAEVRKLLTLAHVRTRSFVAAVDMLNTITSFGGEQSWYADTCVELAETQAETFAPKPAKERVELKAGGFAIFKAYADKFPKHKQIPLVKYFVAEYEYDKLVDLLYTLGKMKDEASPEVLKEKKIAIIKQLHKARKIYESIKDEYPDHRVIRRVDPRIKYLLIVVDKLKRNESFLPKEI